MQFIPSGTKTQCLLLLTASASLSSFLLGFLESAVDKTWVEELFKREMVVFFGAVLMYSDNVFSLVGL
jgi:hypothetical protein